MEDAMRRPAALFGVLALLLVSHAGSSPVRAGDPLPVDLELVLAVDISLSMDLDELQLQREGYIAALRDSDVIRAIRANDRGRISLTYLEWAGMATQQVLVPWALIDGDATAQQFAEELARRPVSRARRTSISGALQFAAAQFEKTPFKGKRRVIDISGDGPNNDGPAVEGVRDSVLARDITINGLPIMIKRASGLFDLPDLDRYYEQCVIGGFAAFVIAVKDRAEFARAIKRKLLLEIAETKGILVPAQADDSRGVRPRSRNGASMDCLIGEKRWLDYMGGRRDTF
jgi:hypothetical protein